MNQPHISFSAFMASHLTGEHAISLHAILADVLAACKAIAQSVNQGALLGNMGNEATQNVQGEVQKKLDLISNEIFIERCLQSGYVAGMASEELEGIVEIATSYQQKGQYLLLFDPLDGSSNVNINVSVGTIFSVLKSAHQQPSEADFLQAGRHQVCAGYALYGTSTMLVLTVGNGVHGFTLDEATQEFYLTHPNLQIPHETQEFAINMSNYQHWQAPVRRYIDECLQGEAGERGKSFNMRWVGSMVADIHRILLRGGVFLYPLDSKNQAKGGRLRLMYEANPMAYIVTQAGGGASTGLQEILDIIPNDLHQRIPVMMGSRNEVELLRHYHQATPQ